jgi:hypothetical protein
MVEKLQEAALQQLANGDDKEDIKNKGKYQGIKLVHESFYTLFVRAQRNDESPSSANQSIHSDITGNASGPSY